MKRELGTSFSATDVDSTLLSSDGETEVNYMDELNQVGAYKTGQAGSRYSMQIASALYTLANSTIACMLITWIKMQINSFHNINTIIIIITGYIYIYIYMPMYIYIHMYMYDECTIKNFNFDSGLERCIATVL